MRTYFYLSSNVSGHNKKFSKKISVYRNVQNKPKLIGCKEVDTRSYMGDRSEAKRIILDNDKQTENYELYEVGC